MDLETITHSEVSQKQKKKYCILMHTCGILKNGTDQPMCRAGIDTQMWRMDVWTWGGRRRGGMN